MLVVKNKASKQNQHKSIIGLTILDMAVTCTHETSIKWPPKQELHKDHTSWKAEVDGKCTSFYPELESCNQWLLREEKSVFSRDEVPDRAVKSKWSALSTSIHSNVR